MKNQKTLVDEAPGKELFLQILQFWNRFAFNEFLACRLAWHSYPLIHDRFWTYSTTYDLFDRLTDDQRNYYFRHVLREVEFFPKGHILGGVFFLMELSKGVKKPISNSDKVLLKRFRDHCKRYSYFSNLICWWDMLINNVFNTNAQRRHFKIFHNDYLEFLPKRLLPVGGRKHEKSPVKECEIEKFCNKYKGGAYKLKFEGNARYSGNKYWVWSYLAKNAVWQWHIYVVQFPNGDFRIKDHAMHSVKSKNLRTLIIQDGDEDI